MENEEPMTQTENERPEAGAASGNTDGRTGGQPGGAAPGMELEERPLEEFSVEELAGFVREARAQAEEHWNRFLRLKAEMENFRRRSERELENAHKYGVEKFAIELLGVRDSLEMGLNAMREASVDIDKLREGGELTLKLLGQVFEKFGIHEIDPGGKRFDPAYHEAVAMQERADVEPNTVLNVVQKGYTLNGRLIRPAMVIVSKGSAGGAQGGAGAG
ncbi:heat shock protein GrpE [bacterium BMS3Bbin12]|nr:heat shock protein GrpE [bacterium BMS3Abin12]GBE48966.1 heat shock protein GrpE [bacterium BMS3Bbin12]GBE49297.1 heat shock protein GrpE [bacterium BMS3Bbin13]HDK03641.1 nucleotide exchange factor GrpE [Gammaproteobacteria bacterium]